MAGISVIRIINVILCFCESDYKRYDPRSRSFTDVFATAKWANEYLGGIGEAMVQRRT